MKIKATKIHFSKVCEFIYDTEKHIAYLGKCDVSELSGMMDELCGDSVVIQFNTDARYEKKDLVKFNRRLDIVAGWTFGEWSHPVINGHPQSFMQCVATRSPDAPSRANSAITSQIEQKRCQIERLENSSGNGHDIVKMVRLREELLTLQNRHSS